MSEALPSSDNLILEALLQQLSLQREAYLETSSQIETLLTQHFTARRGRTFSSSSGKLSAPVRDVASRVSPSPRMSISKSPTDPVTDRELIQRTTSIGPSTFVSETSSRWTGASDDETDEKLYVSDALEPQEYEHGDFRDHLIEYDWDDSSRQILKTIVDEPFRMKWPNLFPADSKVGDDGSYHTHCQVFDIGPDGAPVPIYDSRDEDVTGRAMAVWNAIKTVNAATKQTPAVGRLTILREPSPILFGAIHFTSHKIFDTDEIFTCLVDDNASAAHMHRAFDSDPRRQSSFVFSFEYFTVIGEECLISDSQIVKKDKHIPITRCSAVVALSFQSKPLRKIRNPSRRGASNATGWVYDIWSPWQILNVQAFADWKASTDTHDSTKHYVNGVEAFMTTLLAEYTDAEARFEDIYREISTLITPPLDFMFDSKLRDKLLFEDRDFTYSRRYFWAYQTCGIMIDSLKSLIDSYEDTFTDDVWEGKHKSLWPVVEPEMQRNKYYLKRLQGLRRKFNAEIQKLKKLMAEFHDRRRDITGLRDQLFSGTSVRESRKSIDMAETTVQQGHNIKLLTLVSIFFLPLTFVTSVFGMTNMPPDANFRHFTIATITICVPFFVLVGSLNSSRVMKFWLKKITHGTIAIGGLMTKINFRQSRKKVKVADTENNSVTEAGSEIHDIKQSSKKQIKKMNTFEFVEKAKRINQRRRFRGSVAGQGGIKPQ